MDNTNAMFVWMHNLREGRRVGVTRGMMAWTPEEYGSPCNVTSAGFGGQYAIQQTAAHCHTGSPCEAAMKDYAVAKQRHTGSSVTSNREREPQGCPKVL